MIFGDFRSYLWVIHVHKMRADGLNFIHGLKELISQEFAAFLVKQYQNYDWVPSLKYEVLL